MIENDFACFANKLGDDSIENDSMSPTTEQIRNARPLAAVLSPRCARRSGPWEFPSWEFPS